MLALLCAVVAAFLVVRVALMAAPTVPVLQVTEDISQGDFLAGKTTVVKIARSSVPEGALKPSANLDGAVARHGLSRGDILRTNHILNERMDGGLLSARLMSIGNKDLRAVELPVDSVSGMLGGLKAGDRIDVIAVYEVENGEEKQLESKTILTDRQVVGVRYSEDGSGSASLVAAVTQQEAETLALYRTKGKIYVALRPFEKGDE